jgi:hypothetical protein
MDPYDWVGKSEVIQPVSQIVYTTQAAETGRGVSAGSPMQDTETLSDITDEARRVVAGARDRGEVLRIAGGVAFQLRVAGRVRLPRPPLNDIDLVAPARRERRVVATLTERGYTGEKAFNARHGDRRLIFWDEPRERKLEVFVGTFVMCHELPVTARLVIDAETLPLAELLLTKLQIVELNEKDMADMHSLLITHDVGPADGEQINSARIAALCANDWGLHHTVTRTLTRLRDDPPSYALRCEQRQTVDERVGKLERAIDKHPKSITWRMRAKVGERVRWYEEPEEI